MQEQAKRHQQLERQTEVYRTTRLEHGHMPPSKPAKRSTIKKIALLLAHIVSATVR